MANFRQKRHQNIEGDFFVDDTCIDCDTCRWMAPAVFKQIDSQSAVYKQPSTDSERFAAYQALISCPTASIGTISKGESIHKVLKSFPIQVAENVYHCGYHSVRSYGATSYFILREGGNILVDSPRFSMALVERLEELGGVKYLYLTHRDDVADHLRFHEHFGCERILHERDLTEETKACELVVTGSEEFKFADDLLIIPTPGHTRGHTVLLHRNKYLFTGDHLAYSCKLKNLYAFRQTCWYSWEEQIRSMIKLEDYEFEWVLPGHGRRLNLSSESMKRQLVKCIRWMKEARNDDLA